MPLKYTAAHSEEHSFKRNIPKNARPRNISVAVKPILNNKNFSSASISKKICSAKLLEEDAIYEIIYNLTEKEILPLGAMHQPYGPLT